MRCIAQSLHEASIVFDAHCDTINYVLRGERRLAERSKEGHVDIPRLLQGGVTAQIFACGLYAEGYRTSAPTEMFLRMADAFHRELEDNSGHLLLAKCANDIIQAKQHGKVAAILGMEDGAAIAGDLRILRSYYRLGLRSVGLVWGPQNEIGEGVSGRQEHGSGLTQFGKALIKEMNRIGMIIDVAHLNEKGFWDVVELSADPFITSHSNARALYDHPRNLSDEQIKAIADRGGVVCTMFTFLEGHGNSSLSKVLDHISYIVDLVGNDDHVGIGSDFDGLSHRPPLGLQDAACYPNITHGLLERGYGPDSVQKIIGKNLFRIFSEVV